MVITCLFSWDYRDKVERDEEARKQIYAGRICVGKDDPSSGSYSLQVYCAAHPTLASIAGWYEEYESFERRDTSEGEAYTRIAYHLNEGKVLSFTYDAISKKLSVKLFHPIG